MMADIMGDNAIGVDYADNEIGNNFGEQEELMEYEIRFKDKPHPFCIPSVSQKINSIIILPFMHTLSIYLYI